MKEDKDKKKGHAAGYAILLLVALIVILALLAGVFVTSDIVEGNHEHVWDDGVETTSATCEEAGTRTYTCTECGDKREETILPLGHNWDSEYTEATCAVAGYTTQVCSRCGETLTIEGGAASDNHTWEKADEIAATCTGEGSISYICTTCGATAVEETNALGHDWQTIGDYYTKETCVNSGYITETCLRCGKTTTIECGAATGVHDYVLDETAPNNRAATCGENGTNVYVCSVCGDSYIETVEATGEHDWVEEMTTQTCTTGAVSYTCSVCHQTKTEDAAPLGHDWMKEYTEPTCAEAGCLTLSCNRCDKVLTIECGAPTGIHSYELDMTNSDYKAATCGKGGTNVYVCSVCGDTYTEGVDATGEHDWKEIETTATCTASGFTKYFCLKCCQTKTEDAAPLGHIYECADVWNWAADGEGGVAASLSFVCSVCGYELTVEAKDVSANCDGTYSATVEDPYGVIYENTSRVLAETSEGTVTDVGTGATYTPVYDGDEIVSYTLSSVSGGTTDLYVAGYINGLTVSVPTSFMSGNSSLTALTIGDGVSDIGDYGFHNCTSLVDLTLGDGLSEIGMYAFSGDTSLISVEIPNSVTVIDIYAFKDDTGLESVCIHGNETDSTSIGSYSFYKCYGLKTVAIEGGVVAIGSNSFKDCTSLESVKIYSDIVVGSGGIYAIDTSSFSGCTSLTTLIILGSINIPSGFSGVASNAFNNCPLDTVYFEGTEDQWSAIKATINNNKKFITDDCDVYYYSEEYAESCWYWGEDGMPVLWDEEDKT